MQYFKQTQWNWSEALCSVCFYDCCWRSISPRSDHLVQLWPPVKTDLKLAFMFMAKFRFRYEIWRYGHYLSLVVKFKYKNNKLTWVLKPDSSKLTISQTLFVLVLKKCPLWHSMEYRQKPSVTLFSSIHQEMITEKTKTYMWCRVTWSHTVLCLTQCTMYSAEHQMWITLKIVPNKSLFPLIRVTFD